VHLVGVPPAAQNIEMAWEWPDIAAMFERFAQFSIYTHFDKRGTGSSDRQSRVPGLDERVEDLVAVMDHAGIERAHLLGISEGGPMAILLADSFPDRVLSLILHGTGPSLVPTDATEEQLEQSRQAREAMAKTWGTPESIMVDVFAPSMADNDTFRQWHEVYERRASTPQSLMEIFDTYEVDVVSEILPRLDLPVLVQHRTGDQIIPVEGGRRLAAAIPGAELIEYDGNDHFQYVGDVDSWMTDLERWITGNVVERPRIQAGRPHITVLGRFAVEVGGAEVPASAWGSRLARQLCKRLVVARGWPVTREELVDQLWPDETDTKRLSARLSVHLSGVRKVLGGGVIADRETVRLDLDHVDSDLEQFYTATDDGAIVAAYTGELLPEDRYEEWIIAARSEAQTRFVASGHRLAQAALASDDHATVVDLAAHLITADRYDEQAHRLLVLAHQATGMDSAARQAHQRWAEAMTEIDATVPPLGQIT
jgi:pimeloyl-ACP methyl ester carboxylesterase/DNA-binding SARP family transcriptional activator